MKPYLLQPRDEATGDLIGKKIADKIAKVSYIAPLNNSERVVNEYDKLLMIGD